jgi:hypothetical protein
MYNDRWMDKENMRMYTMKYYPPLKKKQILQYVTLKELMSSKINQSQKNK